MVHDQLWAAAGMTPRGGTLCIGFLERRLGRHLNRTDFTDAPCNNPGEWKPDRLRDRLLRDGKPDWTLEAVNPGNLTTECEINTNGDGAHTQ